MNHYIHTRLGPNDCAAQEKQAYESDRANRAVYGETEDASNPFAKVTDMLGGIQMLEVRIGVLADRLLGPAPRACEAAPPKPGGDPGLIPAMGQIADAAQDALARIAHELTRIERMLP